MDTESAPLNAAALYDRHLRDIYRYVSRRIPRREDAEDITADVFGEAFRCLRRLRSRDNPRVWLYGIARRKVIDHLRRSSRRPELLGTDVPGLGSISSGDDTEGAYRRNEAAIKLRSILMGLNDTYREALILQYVEGLSISEVARVLGRTPTAANSLLQRARAAAFQAGKEYFLEFDSADRGRLEAERT
jgi:RNA polymerase sigma-70 factor (ECF subfamily)